MSLNVNAMRVALIDIVRMRVFGLTTTYLPMVQVGMLWDVPTYNYSGSSECVAVSIANGVLLRLDNSMQNVAFLRLTPVPYLALCYVRLSMQFVVGM